MITKEDLQIKRTPEDLYNFIKDTLGKIRLNKEVKRIARLRRSPYKELIEEVYPLSVFCKLKYKDSSVFCQPIIGNQGYDAIVESDDGELIEIVEISWPIDGQKAHYQAVQLNEKGYTKLEIWDVNDATQRNQIINHIVEKAMEKAHKDYFTQKGSSLVFVLDITPYFGVSKIEYEDDIETLKQQLKEINYKVDKVYLLLLPIEMLIEIH